MRYFPLLLGTILLIGSSTFAATSKGGSVADEWKVTPPDDSSWSPTRNHRDDFLTEISPLDASTARVRHSIRVTASTAESYGTLQDRLPPCVAPEPGFWQEVGPRVVLELALPEFRIFKASKSESGLFAQLVRGTVVETAAHYVTEHMPMDMVASCKEAYVSRADGRFHRLLGIALFARDRGAKDWQPCPMERGQYCAIGESAWVRSPRRDDVILDDSPDFGRYPRLRQELLYPMSIFNHPVFLNWSKEKRREGLIVVEYECKIGMGDCYIPTRRSDH
jgi:hypothetical protein